MLEPEHLNDIKEELNALVEMAGQHFNAFLSRDEEFINAVLRPPVSVRKMRALVRRQNLQPGLLPMP